MNTNTMLTDGLLESALARRAARVRPDGLQEAIMANVERTPQARRPLVARPAWLTLPAPSRRLLMVAAVVGLLVAALAGSQFIGSRTAEPLPRHPAELAPAEHDAIVPERATFSQVATDPTGMLWAFDHSVLTRLDLVSGSERSWTFRDDAAFGDIGTIVPARGGGVWLVHGVPYASVVSDRMVRWFDGERFRDVVPLPPGDINALTESSDGSLWAGTRRDVFRWDGTSWSTVPGRETAVVWALAIDRTGAVWVGGRGVSRYDGTGWETFATTRVDLGPAGGTTQLGRWLVSSIAEAPDASIWIVTDEGLFRYEGNTWTRPLTIRDVGSDPLRFATVTWASDGAAWVGVCNWFGLPPDRTLFARYDGTAWVGYGSADGLPESSCAQPVATSRGVYAATADGLYRPVGERWEPAGP